jgi:predicted  nucleic acid-binding Zn-ribbon protein
MTRKAVIPFAPKEKSTGSEDDPIDQAGDALLELVNHVANTTETDLQEAREVAERLADQLRAANDQISDLEAKVRYYQDRTETNNLEAKVRYYQARADRAERWLRQASSEIEQRFLGADDGRSARQLAFLRKSE